MLRENEDGSSIDVRFFGNPYQRSLFLSLLFYSIVASIDIPSVMFLFVFYFLSLKIILTLNICRAWIPKRNIWDLDEKPPMKKRSKALSLAEDELKIYLRLLTGALNNKANKV